VLHFAWQDACGCPSRGRQQAQYSRDVRKLAERVKRDPATLDEAEVRMHLLRLKTDHHYSGSTMRTAVCAMRNFYGHLLGHQWKLFDLVRSPDRKTLPAVLTRAEVARLFGAIKEPRFRTVLRLIYGCGLRVREATTLQVSDIKAEPPRLHLHHTKGNKERCVPLPPAMLRELRAYWCTHRNPQWVFPGLGRGWREGLGGRERLAQTAEPMDVGSIRLASPLAC
jgi:integrase/recombinase XerD